MPSGARGPVRLSSKGWAGFVLAILGVLGGVAGVVGWFDGCVSNGPGPANCPPTLATEVYLVVGAVFLATGWAVIVLDLRRGAVALVPG